jgi:hypothetical protein
MRRQVATYVTEEEFKELSRQALRHNVSLSRYVKERLLDAESSSGVEVSVGTAVDEIVAAAGRRFSEGVERAVTRALKPLSQRLGIVTAMLDQFALTMLINTPEVPETKKEQAIAAGERRHRGWQRAVEQLLREIQPESAGAETSNGNGTQATRGEDGAKTIQPLAAS